MNDNRHTAIQDCKYALSLSETALQQHIDLWLNLRQNEIRLKVEHGSDIWSQADEEYALTLQEIQAKLHTNECLLKEEE